MANIHGILLGGSLLLKRLWSKKGETEAQSPLPIQLDNIPEHIAIIMDGNGRWAKQKGLPRIAGHRAGMKTVKKITIAANDLGVKYLTLYAFSTENWKRPKEEVEFLMKLPQQFLELEIDELMENNVQVRVMGDQEQLPTYTRKAVEEAMRKTANNDGLVLNFALNYGGRLELLEAVKGIAQQVESGKLQIGQIDEQLFSSF